MSVYRQLLRQGEQFTAYGFREYAKRRTRDAFRENKTVEDPRKVQELVQKGLKELQVMKMLTLAQRQTVIGQFYQLDRLVIEGGRSGKDHGGDGSTVRQKEPGENHPAMLQTRGASHLTSWRIANIPTVAITAVRRYVAKAAKSTFSVSWACLSAQRLPHNGTWRLPVRQWRHEVINIEPPPAQDQQQQNDIWAIELIHGMPKDANLLAPHSQELLRAARSGRLYKRPPPVEEEEADPEVTLPEKPEKKEEDATSTGFTVKLWKQIPRNVEAPTVSHLAKRRKNTVTIASKTVEEKVLGSTVTRATVRRIDAAGNPYTEDIMLVEGQAVKGEIISTRVEAAPAARPDALPPAAPPQRRRPPPPKRKSKAGPGRGKKKIKGLAPGQPPVTGVAPVTEGVAAPIKTEAGSESLSQAPKPEGNGTPNQDSEMADGDDDDDDDEEGDDGEDGEDGEEGEGEADAGGGGVTEQRESTKDVDGKNEDEEMTDVVDTAPPAPQEAAEAAPALAAVDASFLNLPPATGPLDGVFKVEGSPLKNVMIPPPADEIMEEAPLAETESLVAEVETVAPSVAASTVAEPPSTIVGEAPEAATERDLAPLAASTDEALLPPPPEQVGNIATPKAEEAPEKLTDTDSVVKDESQPDEGLGEPRPLLHQDSVMTEDTIKPDDSASVTFPATESGAPSEAGTASAVETKEPEPTESEVAAMSEPAPAPAPALEEPIVEAPAPAENLPSEEPPAEPTPAEPEVPAEQPVPAQGSASQAPEVAASPEEPDLLGGALAELDRRTQAEDQSTAAQPVETAPVPDTPVDQPAETRPEPVAQEELTQQPLATEPTAPESIEAPTEATEASVAPPAAPTPEPPAEAPTAPLVEAPAEAPAEAPLEIPTEAPAEAPVEAPTQARTQSPANVPAEAPETAPAPEEPAVKEETPLKEEKVDTPPFT
ncbi:LYR motif-containing protein 4 [Paramyrothecium foliicola]|nr:LYR motif-containing protein 4 [Paramyrothecium foliicola]